MFKIKNFYQEIDSFDFCGSGGSGGINMTKDDKEDNKKSEYQPNSSSHEPVDNSAITSMFFTTLF